MATDSTKVRVAVTGVVSVGPTTAAAPTTASAALTGFNDLGYVSDDGVTEARDRSTTALKAWQNADTVRQVVTDASITYHFVLWETKKETVELYYGSTVDPTTGSIVIVPSKSGGRQSFVLDVIDGSDFIRAYIPNGEVTEVGDQVYASGEAIGYDVTITCYPSSAIKTADGSPGSVKKFYSSLKTS
jgi:hypothetical protein